MKEINMELFLGRYINYCRFEKGLNAKTIKAYKSDIQQFINFVRMDDRQYDKETIQSYLVSLHEIYTIKSIKRKLASLKAFFNYLEYEELFPANPFSKMRIKLHEPLLLPRTIPLTTINQLLNCAYSQLPTKKERSYSYKENLRDIAVLELLFATGMRISELCSLQIDDVDLVNGNIRIYGKGGKERLAQIGNADVRQAISLYFYVFFGDNTSHGWFFINRLGNRLSDQSVRNMINKYCKIAGIQLHITPHMFRHSFATFLLEEDVDIRYIQHLLGHSTIATTQIYTHVTTKKQRDILALKHPRNKISTLKLP